MTNTRVLSIEGAINFRDIGGYKTQDGFTIKWRKVFRSGQLSKLNLNGCTAMTAMGIQTIVDLRSGAERERYPTVMQAFKSARIIHWKADETPPRFKATLSWRESLGSNNSETVRQSMKENYPLRLYSHKTIYREMLLALSAGNSPLLFHCAAGKDRTGVGAAIILGLLGVPDATIISDYLITQEQLSDKLENWIAGGASPGDSYSDFMAIMDKTPLEVIKPIFKADRIYIEYLLDYVTDKYDGFENYAKEVLDLDAVFVEEFRSAMLSRDI